MDTRKFALRVTIITGILFFMSAIVSNIFCKDKVKEAIAVSDKEIVKSIEIQPQPTKAFNFDGKYKNKYGSIIELKGTEAKLYVESDGPDSGITDIFLSESISNDSKVLKYKYLDNSGGYTILVYETGKLFITDDDPKKNDLIADQFTKIRSK